MGWETGASRHGRLTRESMGETPMPLSKNLGHIPSKQQAGKRGITVDSSLTHGLSSYNLWTLFDDQRYRSVIDE